MVPVHFAILPVSNPRTSEFSHGNCLDHVFCAIEPGAHPVALASIYSPCARASTVFGWRSPANLRAARWGRRRCGRGDGNNASAACAPPRIGHCSAGTRQLAFHRQSACGRRRQTWLSQHRCRHAPSSRPGGSQHGTGSKSSWLRCPVTRAGHPLSARRGPGSDFGPNGRCMRRTGPNGSM